MRFKILDSPGGIPLVVSLSGGYQFDYQMQQAAAAAVMVSSDLGPVHLTANVRVAHYFHADRDPVDLYFSVGALVRVAPWFQVGVEYLGRGA